MSGDDSDGRAPKRPKKAVSAIKVAYLGPEGTYGQQAAQAFLPVLSHSDIELVPCASIAEVYSSPSDYLVMPLQNTLHGSVTETIDCLLSTLSPPSQATNGHIEAGPSRLPRIIRSTDLKISHCLVVKKGTRLEEIGWVRSHEQALGQSAKFLSKYLPAATRHAWPSTASAALSLLQPIADDPPGVGAAICSRAVLSLYPELEVLHEGTQEGDNNYTRFILLSREIDCRTDDVPTRSMFYAVASANSLNHLINSSKRVIAIHVRPSHTGVDSGRYPLSYVVEVEPKEGKVVIIHVEGVACLGTCGD